ncbi:MAG TPA: hypothetical protein VMT11_13475 [Myxococcaceae bacterium]|nr:hypothetical protein [Myxococcaceae bacterium]
MPLVVSALMLAAPALDDDQIPDGTTLSVLHGTGPSEGAGGVLGRAANGSVLGIDSVVNFSSYFYLPGWWTDPYGSASQPQFTWPYTMVGRPPFGDNASDHTTRINAPIIPVAIDLRLADGSIRYCAKADGTLVRLYRSATPHVTPVLNSPLFENAWYSSSERPTQFTDAVHRASFFKHSDDDWHTILRPSVKRERVMTLIRGTYFYNVDANCNIRYVLVNINAFINALVPPTSTDTSTIIGAAEHDGDMTTADITTLLFPDTYLYFPGYPAPGTCCVLGFHEYDFEPGSASNKFRERRYLFNYSSWITPGIFGGGLSDITALSHELAETFADPFVNNATPWWQAPTGLCQDNLETGDVIEGMPNELFPMTMNGFTYHPQNEALVQWFASQSPSSAIHHAYSYPDESVLTSPSVSLTPGCGGPAGPFAKQ